MQPDLGTALVFGAVFVVMSYIAGARLIQLAALGVAGAVGAVSAVKFGILEEYQIARLPAFSDPDCTKHISYQCANRRWR